MRCRETRNGSALSMVMMVMATFGALAAGYLTAESGLSVIRRA